MKNITRYLLPLAGLAAVVPAALADESPSQEKKEMRVIVGPGGPDDRGPAPHHRRMMVSGPQEKESVTFLGIAAFPTDATLAEQLGLLNGTGLVVRIISPDGPASAALKKNDVLTKLDDQLLIDQHQLAVLVRNHKEGDEVTLTYIRGGKESTAKVKLGKHDIPKMAMMGEFPARGNMAFAFSGADGEGLPGMGREDADRVLSLIDRNDQGGPGEQVFNMQVQRDDGPAMRNITVNTSNSNMVFSDDQGSLDLTIKDGKKTLIARNAKGEQLFSGPVTTPDERKAMPADVRERLDKLEGMQDFSFKTDGDFKPGEAKDARPHHQGIGLPVPPPASTGRPPMVF